MRIAICIPDNHPTFQKPFVFSLMSVLASFQAWANKGKDKYEVNTIFNDHGRVDDMRNGLAEGAIRDGYDAVMWMDSDMVFPPMTLIRLVSHLNKNPKLEAASGLYTYKTPPYLPHVYPKLDNGKFRIGASYPIEQPFYVDGAGFGCLLMRTSVFNRLKRPYFTFRFKQGKIIKGEDLGFCRDAKMKMLLDPQIRCGHLRLTPFGIEDYIAFNHAEIQDGKITLSKERMHAIMDIMPQLKKGSKKLTHN